LSRTPAVESRYALLSKSFASARHKNAVEVDALGQFSPRTAFGQQQDEPPVGYLPSDPPDYWLNASIQ